MSGRRSRPSYGQMDIEAVNAYEETGHIRGISIETEPLPAEIEDEIERADPDNAMIQDSLFHISGQHKALKSSELTSDDGVNSEQHSGQQSENHESENNESESDDSLTASDKRRSARDSMIMEDLLDISKKTMKTRNENGEIWSQTTYENEMDLTKNNMNQRRASTKLSNVVKLSDSEINENMNENMNKNMNKSMNDNNRVKFNGIKSGNQSRRDSIDRAIESQGESFLTSQKKEQKWTHARKASAQIVRQKSHKSVHSNNSENTNDTNDINDINDLSGTNIQYYDSYSDSNSDHSDNNEIMYDNSKEFESKQTRFMNNTENKRGRPSINTALKTMGNASDLEHDISVSLAKEKTWKHARKQSTQFVREKSRKKLNVNNENSENEDEQDNTPMTVTKSEISSINENDTLSKVIDKDPTFMTQNENDIVRGIEKQKQLTKYQRSHVSRTFSNQEVKKIKDRREENSTMNNNNNNNNENENEDKQLIKRNNKTRSSQIIQEMEIAELAEITQQHKRQESLTNAYMNAFENDNSKMNIASVLAGFMAGGDNNANETNNNNNDESKAKLLEEIDRLKKENSKQSNDILNLQKQLSNLENIENKCKKLEFENEELTNKMVKINNEYHNEIEKLQNDIKNLEISKIESIQQIAKEFDIMRAAIKIMSQK